ncbi:unnamed protein product, partial [Prorocentrum cordatum]
MLGRCDPWIWRPRARSMDHWWPRLRAPEGVVAGGARGRAASAAAARRRAGDAAGALGRPGVLRARGGQVPHRPPRRQGRRGPRRLELPHLPAGLPVRGAAAAHGGCRAARGQPLARGGQAGGLPRWRLGHRVRGQLLYPDGAQVVCEQLGYYGGFPTGADEFGAAGGPVWLSSLGCAGSEAALGACPHAGWGANSCSHSQDVGVACAEAMTIQDQVRGLIRSQEQPSKCWRGGYIPNFCCHPALGPGGNHVCWGQQGGGRAAALAAGDCCNESTWTALEVTSYHQVLQMEWQRRCDAEREVPIYDGRPEEWMGALSQELLYWFGWLRQGAYGVGRRPDRAEFLRDTDPAAPLDARVRGLLLRARAGWPWPWSTRARVLNIGSGALNGVGHEWPGVDVEVVPADALACEYAQMRKDLGIRVRVPPVPAEVEGLVQRFGGGSFDAAFGSNFLDHAHDPVAGVRQMVLSVRRGGRVLLSHRRNEGESQSYVALHQWNIDAAPALGSSSCGRRRPAAADLEAGPGGPARRRPRRRAGAGGRGGGAGGAPAAAAARGAGDGGGGAGAPLSRPGIGVAAWHRESAAWSRPRKASARSRFSLASSAPGATPGQVAA